jgi:hypothetical protein
VAIGLAGFVFLAFVNLTYGISPMIRSIEVHFHSDNFPGENWLGLAAFSFLVVATFGASLHWRSIWKAAWLFAAPVTALWELVLLTMNPGAGSVHAVNFVPGFISNDVVLLAALGVFGAGTLWEGGSRLRRYQKSMRR